MEVQEHIESLYREAKARCQASREYWNQHAKKDRKGNPCYLDSTQFPDDPANNEIRSFVEWYEFKYFPPESRYFAYMSRDKKHITNWMGLHLARVTALYPIHKSPAFGCFPSRRQNFRAQGINGREYSGTYYVSSGDYVRMRLMKTPARVIPD